MAAALPFSGHYQGRLLDLLRELVTANLTGRLSLETKETKANIFIRTGWVIHAETNGSSGQEALNSCLDVEFANYEFQTGVESTNRTITASFARIMLTHTRQNPTHISAEIVVTSESTTSTDQPLTAPMLATLNRVVSEALGPAGGLVLEDAATELGWELVALPQKHLTQLLKILGQIVNDSNTHSRLLLSLKKAGFNGVDL